MPFNVDTQIYRLYGLGPCHKPGGYPPRFVKNPDTFLLPESGITDVLNANLYYLQIYAASLDKPMPSPLNRTSCMVNMSAPLLANTADTPASFYDWGTGSYKTEHYSIKPSFKTVAAISKWLEIYCFKYGINTIPRLAAFLGNAAVESAGFTELTEDISATAANKNYANQGGNGDFHSGDGYRYRGRGLFQITHKDNYAAFSKFASQQNEFKDPNLILDNPDMVAEPKYAVLSAIWYWFNGSGYSFNSFADQFSFERITRLIYFGHINAKEPPSWPRRQAYQQAAARLIAQKLLLQIPA